MAGDSDEIILPGSVVIVDERPAVGDEDISTDTAEPDSAVTNLGVEILADAIVVTDLGLDVSGTDEHELDAHDRDPFVDNVLALAQVRIAELDVIDLTAP